MLSSELPILTCLSHFLSFTGYFFSIYDKVCLKFFVIKAYFIIGGIMAKITKRSMDQVLKQFRTKKVMTVNEIERIRDCSAITVRRYLNKWRAITSYNFNGRYYVLPDIPEFDGHGLWQYESIRFSQHGNLKKTIVCMVENSVGGLEASAIFKLLGLNSYFLLSHLVKVSLLQRKKIAGVFVYFSVAENRINKQFRNRLEVDNEGAVDLPSDAVAVAILVERIKCPNMDWKLLNRRLQNRGIVASRKTIENFFAYHGILKKTLDSGPS